MTSTFATGVAFLDRDGTVLACNAGFLLFLGLPPDLAGGSAAEATTAALRARAEPDAALRQLLAGGGPELIEITGASGRLELERVAAPRGLLMLVRPARAGEWLEHATRSQGLPRLVAGVAHDIKNPLNAMALQLALLTEKLSGSGEASAAAASHLAAIREQIGRVNEVVRRFLDVTDPSAPLGYTDLGALVADAVGLCGHDARRRQLELQVEAPRGAVRTRCDPGRVARLVLALLTDAVTQLPDGGRLSVRASTEEEAAVLRVEHPAGDPGGETGYYTAVVAGAAAALGGALDVEREGGRVRLTLRLPRNDRA